MRKILLFLMVLAVIGGSGYFALKMNLIDPNTIPGLTSIPGIGETLPLQGEKEQDQSANEKRNAEFLAAQRSMQQNAADLPPPPPPPPPSSDEAAAGPVEMPAPPPPTVAISPPQVDEVPTPAPDLKPEPTVAKAQKLPPKNKNSGFKAGLRPFSKKCEIRAQPKKSAKVVGSIPKGKKIWVTDHDKTWATVNIKSGTAFVLKSCI